MGRNAEISRPPSGVGKGCEDILTFPETYSIKRLWQSPGTYLEGMHGEAVKSDTNGKKD